MTDKIEEMLYSVDEELINIAVVIILSNKEFIDNNIYVNRKTYHKNPLIYIKNNRCIMLAYNIIHIQALDYMMAAYPRTYSVCQKIYL